MAKNKLFLMLFGFFFTSYLSGPLTAFASTCPVLGDVDFSGTVDEEDLILVTSVYFGWSGLTPGDANKDGYVDLKDYNILDANYDPAGTTKTWEQGNFSYSHWDRDVDLEDYNALALNFSPGVYVLPPICHCFMGDFDCDPDWDRHPTGPDYGHRPQSCLFAR